jgi:hypothetical protein
MFIQNSAINIHPYIKIVTYLEHVVWELLLELHKAIREQILISVCDNL